MIGAEQSDARRSYWDAKVNSRAVIVLPGDHLVTQESDLCLVTLLGSCVAACIRDSQNGIGGLNHFLLPEDRSASSSAAGSMRYGTNAMEVLINDILKRGGAKDRLEAKVFGAGNVIDTKAEETVGDRNAKFVVEYLKREGIPVLASDLGGSRARRIFFFPVTGRASVLRLEPKDQNVVQEQEAKLRSNLRSTVKTGTVELF